ncbi:hypothetical protein CN601_16720 [Bacillus sp. AFS017336]|nr:hypothetical protein CN601_16720 [Bacillus sp. AFS017336]
MIVFMKIHLNIYSNPIFYIFFNEYLISYSDMILHFNLFLTKTKQSQHEVEFVSLEDSVTEDHLLGRLVKFIDFSFVQTIKSFNIELSCTGY